jgi:hypothetical protein
MDITLAMAKTTHYLAYCWVYMAYTTINEVNDQTFLLLSPHLSPVATWKEFQVSCERPYEEESQFNEHIPSVSAIQPFSRIQLLNHYTILVPKIIEIESHLFAPHACRICIC